jgi:polysaccharide export outer membrane protein
MKPALAFLDFRFLALVALVAALASGGRAQTGTPLPAPGRKVATYTLTTNDRLNVVVVDENDLNLITRVNARGVINLTWIGEVHVAGLTVREAQKAIEDAYRDGRYLRNPQVIINVEEYAPREVFISGEVKQPGKYALTAETVMTIDELVLKAGGFTDQAKGSAVIVTRKLPDGSSTTIGPIDVESIIKGEKNAPKPLELIPGDSVLVKQRIF